MLPISFTTNKNGEKQYHVFHFVKKMLKGHDKDNFTGKGSFELQRVPLTYWTFCKFLRIFSLDKSLNLVTPVIDKPTNNFIDKLNREKSPGKNITPVKQEQILQINQKEVSDLSNLIKIMLSEGLKDAYAEASGRKRGGIFSGAVKSDRTLEMAAERGRLKDLQDKIINFYACGGLDGLCTRIPKPENYLAGDRPFQGIATGAAAPVDNTMDAEPEITTKVRSISEINAEKIRRRKPVEGWRLDERIRRGLAQEIDNANIALGFDITRRR